MFINAFDSPPNTARGHAGWPVPVLSGHDRFQLLLPILLLLILLGAASLNVVSATALPEVQPGDLIFQTSKSSQSEAIQRATGSRYSHMGLVLFENGEPMVLEAISTVRMTPLADWIARGVGHHYVVKRLKEADTVLTAKAIRQIESQAKSFLGQAYDLNFEWSDHRIYCSELVWKIYDQALGLRIGALQPLGTFNLSDQSVQNKMAQRYGTRVPKNEMVISPGAMFESPLLITVFAK